MAEAPQGEDEDQDDQDKECDGQEIVVDHQVRRAVRQSPEEEEREREREGQEEGETVGSKMVRRVGALAAWRVVDEVGNILNILLAFCLLSS